MDKTLTMKFKDNEEKKISFSLTDIKDDLTSEEVSTLMDTILKKQSAFNFKHPLVAKDSAQIIARTVEEVFK